MTKLKPCPFCGGEAEEVHATANKLFNPTAYYYIKCKSCDSLGKPELVPKHAAAAWNSRTGKDINVATNADRIRSMSDEELAEYIFDLGNGSEYCYGHCAYQDDCATKGLDHDTCIKGVIDWLKQPAKEKHK